MEKKKRVWIYAIIVLIAIVVGTVGVIVYEKSNDNKSITKCIKKGNSTTAVTSEEELKAVTPSTNNPVNDFLDKAGWSLISFTKIKEEEMPASFEVKEDELPFGLIWAYNNELSKVAGLDFLAYKGKKIKTYTMNVKSKSDENNIVPCNILICDKKIIGAWFGEEGTCGFMGFGEEGMFRGVNTTIEKLAENVYKNSYSDKINEMIKNLQPQEMIKMYFDALNKKDYKLAYYLLDIHSQIQHCTTGEKKISDKFFAEEKIELLSMEKDLFSQNEKFQNELGEEVQIESYALKAKGRFKGEKEDITKRGVVSFMKSGNNPWKIQFVGLRNE